MSALAETLKGSDWPSIDFPPPRICHVPTQARRDQELENEAIYLCGEAGLILDPWQDDYFRSSLRLREDDKWGAIECGLCVPRQNGKTLCVTARELVALFIDQDRYPHVASRLAIHSAHNAQTAHEGFEQLSFYVEQTPRLRAKLKGKPRQSEGGEMLRTRDERRIRFRTRTNATARGLSGDLLVFDEAMILSQTVLRAVWSIVTARMNPQIWYLGSAVDDTEPLMDEHGVVFSRIRSRGIKLDADLLYSEWSLDYGDPDEVPREVAAAPETWALTNPNLDNRISRRVIAVEQRQLPARGFAVERLGVGSWPDPDETGRVIGEQAWEAARVDKDAPGARMLDPVCFALDVSPRRDHVSISAAGRNGFRKSQVEVLYRFANTNQVVETLKALVKNRRRTEVIVDSVSSAASLIPELELEKVNVVPVTGGEYARGCGMFYDGVVGDSEREVPPSLNHLNDPSLNAAVTGAKKRTLGDRWAWDRKDSTVDITPLVSSTLALYGFLRKRHGAPGVYGGGDLLEEEEQEEIDLSWLPPLDSEDL